VEPDHRAALRADQIVHRDADRPAELARLGDDLIRGVLGPWPADLRNRFHRFDGLEELHADRDRPQPEILGEAGDQRVPVVARGAHGVLLLSCRR
jgi:hypothetical protein